MAKDIVIQGMEFEELFTPEQIDQFSTRVADQINHDYQGKEPLFVVMLNGAFIFAADLFRKIKLHSQITFTRLKSYEGTASTGEITELVAVQAEVKGKDVIVIEDIVDTGYTMRYFKQHLREMGAKSISVAAELFKPEALLCPDARPDYYGAEIPKRFIVGCGFDIDDNERNLPSIYALKD